MADVFEDHPLVEPERQKLWQLIQDTPMLDWLLLTKRPENILRFAPWQNDWPANVWAMVSVEDQEQAEKRIPLLIKVPAKVRGLSVEPLIGAVHIEQWLSDIQWVIVGGESGHHARPMQPEWVYSLRNQCQEQEVAFFFKQWGEWKPVLIEGKEIENLANLKMKRVGKKAAGRMLDNRTWDEIPDSPMRYAIEWTKAFNLSTG
jgi:protein gp37